MSNKLALNLIQRLSILTPQNKLRKDQVTNSSHISAHHAIPFTTLL